MSICQPNSIYWEMLDGARDLISRYFDTDDRYIELFVTEVSEWMDKYSIDSSVKRYPSIIKDKTMYKKAQILDIWTYYLTQAMLQAVDDVSAGRFRVPREK